VSGDGTAQSALDFVATDERAGFRLHRLEIYNWGTFHQRIWSLVPGGDNTLLTGDIGSGKSTLVDAITTLLVPPQKIAYNKAAGADTRERTLRSYVLGHYKTERGDVGLSARPVSLRDSNCYSVLLARFFNEGYDQTVTLAQVFWLKDMEGQPAKLFVVSDGDLSIAEHFANFGSDIADLRKRLRRTPKTEIFDAFAPYAAAFRRRFGIENDQALDLFHQTVSMKSVGNLTDFVRQHMLEAFPVEERIEKLVQHFDDLNRAHEAVLKAKAQITQLRPIIVDCQEHGRVLAEVVSLRDCRNALHAYFAGHKAALLDKRLGNLRADIAKLEARIAAGVEERRAQQATRDETKHAIAEHGGDRIERIKAEIAQKQTDKDVRSRRADQYAHLAAVAGLPTPAHQDAFLANRRELVEHVNAATGRQGRMQNDITEISVELRGLKEQHGEIARELISLRTRRSNIPARILAIRTALCQALGLEDESLPFVGELVQVRSEDRDWEGAIERLMHSFGLSLLVPDADYARVAQWVDRTHLGERLVYFRVLVHRAADVETSPAAVLRKLVLKPDSPFYDWLEGEIARRFDHVCCDTLEQFRREKQALTRSGQIKTSGGRHEKDDRHRLDDRSRYILGWSNEAKIAALDAEREGLEARMHKVATRLSGLQGEQQSLAERLAHLHQLSAFEDFRELDWKPLLAEIERLEGERRQLEAASDILRALEEHLAGLEVRMRATEAALESDNRELATTRFKCDQAAQQRQACLEVLDATPAEVKTRDFPRIEEMRDVALGLHILSVESCDGREKDLREWLQKEIDGRDQRLRRLEERIVKAMEAYRKDYPVETQELDARLDAASEFGEMLRRLEQDDLPRFEAKFKELLNENAIREVANFQSQLHRERQTIRERIDAINRSLRDIDYNPNRYIALEIVASQDVDVRDFQQDLRACTEGALTGSEDSAYSESKFLQVKRLIERFRGREGSTDADRRWTRRVTDVRFWFSFSVSERWREDDREHEHYTDSGGKSGGQKEKLAYTVLAASLAYQFGLERGVKRSRSFRFVAIDEAFGRGSDESARYALELFGRMNLQLLIVTPLQKIHIIEPHVSGVGFVHTEDGRSSMLRNLTIEEYRQERAARVVGHGVDHS
jgi:uncharacterized protein YPO0396